ncbi:hypothetical protein BN6_56280 [Saccharothrix espanaensis DSM 44229]|uniref:RES domain-containing protein n=2 Tax=Saccharothrix espanaensis TaxID=103731 RepID=K0K5K8_SACES|nr:hypothetical protein BN6_56280 [Saccharothrix espanaensis DSM 44229]
MTGKGQSAFYGSTSLQCAVDEVARSADIAFSACSFAPSRPLFHFDAFAVPDPPSPFAEDACDDTQALAFLRRFAETLSEPNTDDDQYHYVPTQLFTEYLLAGPEELRPDAVRFASSLDSQYENWVVFVDNSRCLDAPTTRAGPVRDHVAVTAETASGSP